MTTLIEDSSLWRLWRVGVVLSSGSLAILSLWANWWLPSLIAISVLAVAAGVWYGRLYRRLLATERKRDEFKEDLDKTNLAYKPTLAQLHAAWEELEHHGVRKINPLETYDGGPKYAEEWHRITKDEIEMGGEPECNFSFIPECTISGQIRAAGIRIIITWLPYQYIWQKRLGEERPGRHWEAYRDGIWSALHPMCVRREFHKIVADRFKQWNLEY